MLDNKKNLDESNNEREQFGSKLGFILACIGSAIGMGNIWMFPWRVGKFGGAAFLIPYLIFVIIFGTIGLITEFSFGRMARKGAVGAFDKILTLKNKKGGKLLGLIPVIGISFIAIGYAIVVGWVLKYLLLAITGRLTTVDPGPYFGGFVGGNEPIVWHFLAILITLGVLVGGVAKGIERVNKIIMPCFFILFFILIIRAVTLPNAKAGLDYLLVPNWSFLLKPMTWIMAMGQAFFTVSLGGAGMLVYGSYIGNDVDLPNSAVQTVIFDTLGALMAAFVIIPSVFAFNLDPAAGPPLLFISLPYVFQKMPFGTLFAVMFFVAILFAAVSSLLNLMEAPIEAVMDKISCSRVVAGGLVSIVFFVIGLALDLRWIDLGKWMDFASVNLIPLGAILAAVVFYWIYDSNDALLEINKGAKKPMGQKFLFTAKFGYVFVASAVLVLGIIFGGIG